jgi:hypothetical protein
MKSDIYASKIQKAWRAYCNRRVYSFLRNIILNKLKSAPVDLLKTIIPDESAYFDRGSAIHVRFRLGGSSFPPKILFKVFTHQSLCDIGAFAPRNYSLEQLDASSKSNQSLKSHAKAIRHKIRVGAKSFDAKVSSTVHMDKWYQREENNPWRPIIPSKLVDMLNPVSSAISYQSTSKSCKQLTRKQDIAQRRKQKKREWMMKAYMYATKLEDIKNDDQLFDEVQRIQHYINDTPLSDDLDSPKKDSQKITKDKDLTATTELPAILSKKTSLPDWKDSNLFHDDDIPEEELLAWRYVLVYCIHFFTMHANNPILFVL